MRAWAVVSAPIRLARCVSVIALAAFARIPFAARASGPLPSRAQAAFGASGVLAARLPSAPLLLAGPVLAASPAARPPFPPKCAENGDIDTPGHVAFDKLHFII